MKHEDYNAMVEATFDNIRELAHKKGGEYSGDVDRLANFRRNAAALALSMESVWAVYAAKHWDAIMQYVQDINTGKTRPRMESLEGRVDDLLVYLLLFKGILREQDVVGSPEGSRRP